MPRRGVGKGKEIGKVTIAEREPDSPHTVTTPPPADEAGPDVKEAMGDQVAQSVVAESVFGEDGDDEPPTPPKSKRTRVLSKLTDNEHEDVALFLEQNDFI